MSSPPPTTPNPLNPRKRPSISSVASGAAKRPRMHPLRQTSFPTGMEPGASRAASDAGSVTGSFTGSLGGSIADGPRKRGRKKKNDAGADGRSTRFGSIDPDAASVRDGAGGGAGGAVDEAGEEEEEQDVEGELLDGTEGFLDYATEKKNLAVLTNSFTPLQADRYEKWNRTRLRKETLRRIVNHALSQSVPQSVVTVINGFSKVFIGEIVEKALAVQDEWADAYDIAAMDAWIQEQADIDAAAAKKARAEADAAEKSRTEAGKSESRPSSESKEGEAQNNGVKQEPGSSSSPNDIPAMLSPAGLPADHKSPYTSTTSTGQQLNGESTSTLPVKREFVPPVNPHRGQLLPDHLREALRRYKRNGEGGGTGMAGLSQPALGVKGSFTWQLGAGGKQLFR
ncbi:hTAFII28-like protein conserved region-domain-containing protein [Talaromyces proteolyticus]|uniref:HTAFII28-like protein conserved region-domain-containing protein n=1 Tax=Talaromyces proteolyticus TaxID=1131652 RepID=A0AAD4KVV5_9EURO|nr:hTAFII28-like protein conserved region-domain-containing protein [Talaromyces proteolyticus]KAH8702177.1 hTAFII28-like protein conserved region-domain-containing protein [Talaromyces proteolyticus]